MGEAAAGGHGRLQRLPRLLAQALAVVWRAAPREFARSAGLQLVAGAGLAAQLLVGREVLARLLAPGAELTPAAVLPPLVVLALVSGLVAFARVARVEQQRLVTELVARHATGRVIEVATAVDLLDFDRSEFHDRLERARVNAVTRPVQMATGLLGIVSAGFAAVGIAGALLVLQPLFLGLVVVAYLPAWYAARRAGGLVHAFASRQTERDRRRAYLFYLLTDKPGAAELRAFGLGPAFAARHDQLYEERIADLRGVARRRLVLGLLGALVASGLTAGTLGVLVWLVAAGRMDMAAAATAAAGVVLLAQRLQALSGSAGSLYEASLFLEDVTSFLAEMPGAAPVPGADPPPPFRRVAMDDVTFTYPAAGKPSLRGVSLEVRAGEVVALVGENGSGKTTAAKLLAGLYAPGAGRVTWDGEDLTAATGARPSTAVIFQDFVRYHLPARENVEVGRHEHAGDDTRLAAAARRAGIDGALGRLPGGYETLLGPEFLGGSELSVGQWQRVALARAFFRDAPFLVLDEPTAALDPRAEARLFDDVRALYEDRAVLLISHRFSSVRAADRIYVLHDGQVVEAGTHEELMASGGRYAELYALQAAAYLDAPPVPADG